MFRAVLISSRRLIFACSLLFLLICGAEVGVRLYEAATGTSVCPASEDVCSDPSKLAVPSWSVHQELKPSASAKVECRDAKIEFEVRTNSRGLRGAEPVVPKPANLYRIVVLGDETIFAPETPESEHFCTHLRTHLQPNSQTEVEVINAGIPGHCPLTEYVLFKQRLLGLQPDLVILHFDWSDVSDDRQIRRHTRCDESRTPQACPHAKLAATKKGLPHEVWRHHFRLLDWALSSFCQEWKQQIARKRATSRNLDTNPYAWLRDDHPEEIVAFRDAITPITELAKLCQSSNCEFVVMTSPKPWQVSAKCSRGAGVRLNAGVARDAYYSNRAPFNVLARFAAYQKIPLFDGSVAIASGDDVEANFLRHAPRWSREGHHRMAEQFAQFIVEKVPGSWSRPSLLQNDQSFTRRTTNRDTTDSQIQWTSGQQPTASRPVPPATRQAP